MAFAIAILFAFGSCYVFSQTPNDIHDGWQDVLFSDKYFSEKYFKHSKIEKRVFFIKENEQWKRLIEGNATNVLDLKSGYFVAVVANGYLFAWGIENYLEVETILISEESIRMTYSLRESDGFKERVVCKKEVVLKKKGSDWTISALRDIK